MLPLAHNGDNVGLHTTCSWICVTASVALPICIKLTAIQRSPCHHVACVSRWVDLD